MKITHRSAKKFVLYFILTVIGLLFISPIVWMILSSLKLNQDVLALPVSFLPPTWNFKSYYNAWTYPGMDFIRYLLNNIIVTIFSTLIVVFLCTTAGYGFSKFKFKGRNFIFMIILSTIMIPFISIMIPLFILITKMGLRDTYLGLILPMSVDAFSIFLMRQFINTIPTELIEAARIDGANEFRIFFNIIIPLSKTAIIAIIIFQTQWVWNMLLWPLIVVYSNDMRTLPLAIVDFTGNYRTPFPEQLAMSVSAIIPMLVLYLLLSRYFKAGITLSGLKE